MSAAASGVPAGRVAGYASLAFVSALPVLLLARMSLALAGEPTPATGDVVLYIVPSRASGLDSRALVEAVGIYTRDLGLTVRTVADDSLTAVPSAIVPRVTALVRARGARLAFWCAPLADGRAVALFSVDGRGTLRRDVVAGDESRGPDFQRAVALKLRAILTPWSNQGASDAPAASATVPLGAAEGPVAVTAPPASIQHTASSSFPSPGVSAPSTVPLPAAASPPATRWGAAIEYGLSLAPGSTSTSGHQSLGLEMLASPRSPAALEIYVGGSVAGTAQRTVSSGTLTLSDVPLRLGARWVASSSRGALAVGLFGAVHILSASAAAVDGAKANVRTAAGGAGIEALLRAPAFGRVAAELSAWGEGIGPRTRFFVGDSQAVQTGRYAIGLGVAVVFATR